MCQSCAVVISFVDYEHLGLIFQTSECCRMQYPIPIALEGSAVVRFFFQETTTPRIGTANTIRGQELVFEQDRKLVEVSYFENNDLLVKASYAKFLAQDAVYPARLSLAIPAKYATVSLDFSDVETNGRLQPGVFEVKAPAGANVVYLPE